MTVRLPGRLSVFVLATLAFIQLMFGAQGLLDPGTAQADLAGHGGPVNGLTISSDGKAVLTAGFDYSVILWDLESEEERHRLEGHDAAVNAVAFLPDGSRALSASDDQVVILWDLKAGAELRRFTGHQGKVVDLAVSADGRFAASASWDLTVRIWDLQAESDASEAVVLQHRAPVNAVAFLADKGLVVTGAADSTIRIWEAASGKLTQQMSAHDFGVSAIAVAADGRHAVSSSADETLRYWDLETGEEIAVLRGHQGAVLAAAISQDGRLAASGGTDGKLRIWRLDSEFYSPQDVTHKGVVWSLAFTPEADVLISAGADALARVWRLDENGNQRTDGVQTAAAGAGAPDYADIPGAWQFRKCAICHSLTDDDEHKAGPSLHGVFGRRVGTLEGYSYSPALRDGDLIWDEESIDALFRLGPDVVTPGSKMPIQRIPKDEDRAELIEFLKRAAGYHNGTGVPTAPARDASGPTPGETGAQGSDGGLNRDADKTGVRD